ncbi:ABC-2 type transport system permease protein [Paenibacillus phyllosphaerae]|uniref:ABC-2 type transport system permease protein n=1 Tax=Paenibacillus phyllosphaerae TaxID=274593 RepID=A0A7W5AUS1_9BACL|nr:ABC transporter permease [Paenibacillus phyllosphaerae]MBB3108546.1 ABC-2 type transport system permease protein [Paenibacillus phyllosphaerae]
MFDFIQLIRNENMKIYTRVRTWIMLGILVGLVLAIGIIALTMGESPNNWTMMQTESMILFMLVTIFTVVISAESVAGEFTAGTIKLLLIRPWSRSKILLSKYISLLLFALLQAAVLFVFTFAVNAILFGYDGSQAVTQQVLGVNRDIPPLALMLLEYICQIVNLIIVVTMSFMISTVFRSGGLAIGLSLFLLLGGSMITGLLSMLNKAWVDYILFLHMDLTPYISSPTMDIREGVSVSLGFSLGVLAVYYIVFIAVTWYVFKKRDVAA